MAEPDEAPGVAARIDATHVEVASDDDVSGDVPSADVASGEAASADATFKDTASGGAASGKETESGDAAPALDGVTLHGSTPCITAFDGSVARGTTDSSRSTTKRSA